MTPRNTILVGDAVDRLRGLAESSVDCVITSPPYFQLRDYGVAGQLGLEATVEDWVDDLSEVMAAVGRVLKPTGSLWLNLGDSYSRHSRYGAPAKGQLLAPERLLVALSDDGWIVRNKIIWAKTNSMPSSVGDRLNTTYEVVYLLVRSRSYFFDLDAIRLPHRSAQARPVRAASATPPAWAGPLAGKHDGLRRAREAGTPGHWLGKNPGDVWWLAAGSYRGAHFATFPEALVERPLLAGCPERVCVGCGQPWRRGSQVVGTVGQPPQKIGRDGYIRRYASRYSVLRQRGEIVPDCRCQADTVPGLVLDPFFGTGTVGVVAKRLGRDWLGIELNPEYARLARQRLGRAKTEHSKSEVAA